MPFRNTFEANKGQKTENQKRTANVQMARTVQAVQACQPHFKLTLGYQPLPDFDLIHKMTAATVKKTFKKLYLT